MQAQIPAEGILKTSEWGDSKYYQVVCECGDSDHDHRVEIEADNLNVCVHTYITVKSNFWSCVFDKRYDIEHEWLEKFDWAWKNFVNGLLRRIQLTWTLWTKGYIETESTLIMSEQQALNYAETLKTAIKDVKSFKEANFARNKSDTL
jgi:hypothetical protein